MYYYNNVPNNRNVYYNGQRNQNGDRFFPFLGPLLVGGVAGYAIGANNRPNYPYPYPGPVPYYPYPMNNNNYYYPCC